MWYIVGLGNPGEKYTNTRHNVGFAALDVFRDQSGLGTPVVSQRCGGEITEGMVDGEEVTLLYPTTFMNHSGSAVKKLVPKEATEKLIVICDDVDIPVGAFKVSFGRGDGGHNGISSIIKELGTKDFIRIRVGIAQKSFWSGGAKRPAPGAAMSKHVLGTFTTKETKLISEVLEKVAEAIRLIQQRGVAEAMNKYN